jgi:hypothetical protein
LQFTNNTKPGHKPGFFVHEPFQVGFATGLETPPEDTIAIINSLA